MLLEYMGERADEIFSAQEIAAALGEQDISLSAVYRNLAELEAGGRVRRVSKGSARGFFYQYVGAAACRGCLHLTCKRCGRTYHMDEQGAARLLSVVNQAEGFAVDKADTVLYGVCELCRD